MDGSHRVTIAEFAPRAPSKCFREALVEIEYRAETSNNVYIVKRLSDGERYGAYADELTLLFLNYSPKGA